MAARIQARYLVAALLIAAPPAAASSPQSQAWQKILRAHHVSGRSRDVFMRPGNYAHRRLSVILGVRASAPDPVSFSDSLYGATAWVYRGGRYRRLDSAEVRAAAAPQLEPGEHARVQLPLKWHARTVRVLVPVPADGRGAWVDLS